MRRNIKSILAKGKWTGAEIGKLLLQNLCNDVENQTKGITDYEPLFTTADINRMVATLYSDRQYTAYQVYVAIFNFMVHGYNKCHAYVQQFSHGYYRYKNALTAVADEERRIAGLMMMPVQVSQSDYDRFRATAEEANKKYRCNWFSIVKDTAERYASLYADGKTEDIPQAIQDALEALRGEEASREAVLLSYRNYTAEREYTLDDKEGDAEKKRHEAIAELFYRGLGWFIDSHKLTDEQRKNVEMLQDLDAECVYETLTDNSDGAYCCQPEPYRSGFLVVDEAIRADIGDHRVGEWTYTDQVCDKLCALLPALGHHFEIATCGEEEPGIEKISKALPKKGITKTIKAFEGNAPASFSPLYYPREWELYQEFEEDYPLFLQAIIADIDSRLPGFAEMPIEWRSAEIFSWGFLADNGLQEYVESIVPTKKDIASAMKAERGNGDDSARQYDRACKMGFSIVQGYEGSYREMFLPGRVSIEAMPEHQEKDIKYSYDTLITQALSYIHSFNSFVDILTDVYGVDISPIKADESALASAIEQLNVPIFTTFAGIEGSCEERARKRKAFRSLFKPLSADIDRPTEEAVEEIRERIASMGTKEEARVAFTNNIEQFVTHILQSTPAYTEAFLQTISKKV